MLKAKTIGFIGAGNMAEALIRGLLAAQTISPDQIWTADVRPERLEQIKTQHGIHIRLDNADVIRQGDVIVYAVKPQVLADVATSSAAFITENKLVISIAAGVPLAALQRWLAPGTRIVRAMPNMCATVLQGITALVAGQSATSEDMALARAVFDAVGRSLTLKDESLMDAVTGLSGSGPAYVFVILEALADAGVQMGLPREDALELAAQTVLGAAAVYLKTRIHPGQLKDMVTSPAGTTIAGLGALEKGGIRHILREAVEQASERSRQLGRLWLRESDKQRCTTDD